MQTKDAVWTIRLLRLSGILTTYKVCRPVRTTDYFHHEPLAFFILWLRYIFTISKSVHPTSKVETCVFPMFCVNPASTHQKNGGGGRDRTDDLKLAKLPLSQLSYAPVISALKRRATSGLGSRRISAGRALPSSPQRGAPQDKLERTKSMVGLGGLEPPTSRLSGVRSSHLSYRPKPVAPDGASYQRAPEGYKTLERDAKTAVRPGQASV